MLGLRGTTFTETMQARLNREAAANIINERVDPTMELRTHALELVHSDPGFVEWVLHIPGDKQVFLMSLAKVVDRNTLPSSCAVRWRCKCDNLACYDCVVLLLPRLCKPV